MKIAIFLHIFLSLTILAQNNLKKMTSIEPENILPKSKTSDTCVCSEIYFIEHKDVKIIQCNTIPLLTYDSLDYCFSNNIKIYNELVNIDSVYHNNIENKSLVYNAGFIEGKYIKNKRYLFFYLYFINGRLNTSRSSLHLYTIKYNLKNKRIHINISFIEENSAVPP